MVALSSSVEEDSARCKAFFTPSARVKSGNRCFVQAQLPGACIPSPFIFAVNILILDFLGIGKAGTSGTFSSSLNSPSSSLAGVLVIIA
jgi:hypothetical protein